mgnify:CR=1 FL=1
MWHLLQTEHLFSSELSPHPSRPEQTTALDRHLPFVQRNGQYCKLRTDVLQVAVQELLGSSDPSVHEMTALQNSYSGKHRPSSHWNVCTGQSTIKNQFLILNQNYFYFNEFMIKFVKFILFQLDIFSSWKESWSQKQCMEINK